MHITNSGQYTNCPHCKELLVLPRDQTSYCEDCGWGDEKLIGSFTYYEVGFQLEGINSLQFYDGNNWVPSGLNYGRVSPPLRGRYRALTADNFVLNYSNL